MKVAGGAVAPRPAARQEAQGEALYLSITEDPKPAEILRGLVSKAKNWRQPDAPYWVIQQVPPPPPPSARSSPNRPSGSC